MSSPLTIITHAHTVITFLYLRTRVLTFWPCQHILFGCSIGNISFDVMSSTSMVCFNSSCKEVSDNWRRGWRRRTGEYANLCDLCASAYEDGKFCETFHLNASGWRCCESCGKQIHCGCIVSFHMFVLLDAGGIECLSCAKKSYILTPNPAWPPPSQFLPSQPERMKDLSAKTWSAIAGSGPVPWRQAPSLSNGSNVQSDVLPKLPFDINVSGSVNRICGCDRLCAALPEAKQERLCERLVINRKLGLGSPETFQNGISGLFRNEQSHLSVNDFSLMSPTKNSSSNHNLATASSSKIETDGAQLSGILPKPSVSVPMGKPVCNQNGMESSTDPQIRSGKARADGRCRNYLLTRYRPQITDEELQQISSDSKSIITPLFEKMLSASDAGKIGRLVLPKKCAEAYFPYISQPEGLPLNVQDVKGNEWVFQFRFWPNNNSRMYVLEGITPCIQSLQLQAGDVVTFSRLEPEGKLVMGGRKSSANPSSDQVDEVTWSSALTSQDGSARNNFAEVISTNGQMKGRSSSSTHPVNQDDKVGTGNTCSELDKSGFSAKKILEVEPAIHGKRKNSNLGVKSKRVRIENVDLLDLKITFKEAQVLMRSPAKSVPSVSLVEGCEFEEFEGTAPVVGRPTIPAIDHLGEKIQWVQCEDCFKWRKVPADALLSSRWICSENVWDLDRSLCSAPEELTLEQLEDMLPSMNKGEKEITEQDEDVSMALEGLDTLANLAIQGEAGSLTSSADTRTKHPRHKPGCTCIVCLQPPSGSKHEQPCDCVACVSLKRRFKTLLERREKRQLEKLAECASLGTQPEDVQDVIDAGNSSSLNIYEPPRETQASPLKGQIIDLNIQPEREDEILPEGRVFKQQCTFGASDVGNIMRKQMQQDGVAGGPSFVTCMALDRFDHGKTS